MTVMQQTIEHGAHGSDIAQQLAPVLDGTIGGRQRAETLVAAHDDFQQILGGGMREFAHAGNRSFSQVTKPMKMFVVDGALEFHLGTS